MRRICKLLLYILISLISSPVLAYQIGVWDSFDGNTNPALTIKSQENKFQRVTKNNLSAINSNIYPVLIFTRYQEFDENVYNKIIEYTKNGGKLIISLPQAQREEASYIKLAKLLGVNVNSIKPAPERLEINWVEKTISQNSIYQGEKVANVSLFNDAKHLAVFGEIERHESAISLNSSGSVISWVWGKSGSGFFNEKSMQYVLEELLPAQNTRIATFSQPQGFSGLSEDVKKLHSTRDYIEKYQEIPVNFGVDMSDAQQNLEYSKINEMWALYYLKNGNSREYEKHLKLAKDNACGGVCGLKDLSGAESRGIWFDRGTIVNIKSRSEMGRYFERLKKSGINTIYFETVNAGYTIYPSKIGTQNPLTKGKDPLSWAIEEAHSRNMKLQAWVWVFAAGNDRHNKIINKDNDYAGPVLEKNMRWAMLGESGNLRPKNQPEFWIDPSNREGVNYLLSIIEEIENKYNVDGIQLDYIRYPFQKEDNLMGFNHNSMEEFTIKTGEKIFNDNYQTNTLWNKWKETNINNFVKTAYLRIKKIKPNAKVSAAIFTKSQQNRLTTIQQNWESWAENGYVDFLTPMSYSMNVGALSSNVAPLKNQIGNCLIYPGVALQHVDEKGIMEQAMKIREEGFPGVSFFAMAQLVPEKSQILENGFYSSKTKDTTYELQNSALLLLDEYKLMMSNFLKANSDLSQTQKSEISSMITDVSAVISYINTRKNSDALQKLAQLEYKNSAFFKKYVANNDLKRQTASSYLKRAENLIKIATRKKG